MSTINVGIVGLGRIGTSMALALKRYNQKQGAQHQFIITAVEGRPGEFKELPRADIIDRQTHNLIDAVSDRDIVVLAQPYADTRRIYQTIGKEIRAGGVILDTAPLKGPSLAWAKEFLHPDAHLVGVTPIFNPAYLFEGLDDPAHAREDLFDKGYMLVMPSATCIREAVELATDFSALLGADVHFLDPVEHDALMAATDALPALLGVALFWSLARSPGWDDLRRLTNPRFGRMTHMLFDTHPDDLRDTWLNNRDDLLRYTDQLIEGLEAMRDVIRSGDRSAVEAALVEAADDYSLWINRRFTGKWQDDDRRGAMPSPTESIMTGLLGGQLAKRLRGGGKSDAP